MPRFVSKVQHYINEKGEYSDEKVRSLEQTLALIKDFPWDAERGMIEYDVTGPSVTICDENGRFLKVGLSDDTSFCIYSLDQGRYLTYRVYDDLDEACKTVKDFFEGTFKLDGFSSISDKKDNISLFTTKAFIYRPSLRRAIGSFPAPLILSAIAIFFFIKALPDIENIFLYAAIICWAFVGYLVVRFYHYKGKTLKISRGEDIFNITAETNNVSYNKNEIEKVVIYTPSVSIGDTKQLIWCYAYDIYFTENTILRLSSILIPVEDFKEKFPPEIITYSDKNPLWRL